MSVCLALDHVSKNAMFRCDAEFDRLCAKLFSYSDYPFLLRAFSEPRRCGLLSRLYRSVNKTLPSSPIFGRGEEGEVDVRACTSIILACRLEADLKSRVLHLRVCEYHDYSCKSFVFE